MGQAVSLSVSLYFNFNKNHDIKISFKNFRPSGKIIGQIYKVGIPSILLSSISSLTTYFINLILGAFSTTAIAVYGVYFKLNSFIFMPVFGLNNGIVPIIAYNYGAKNKERLLKTIKVGTLMAVSIMTFGMLLFMIIPETLLNLFSASESMLKIGIPAMRIISTSFIGAAIAISLSSVFQAFGKAFYSMLVSFIRQIFFLLPSAYLLSLTGNINNIWFCFPIAEIVAVILSVFFLKNIFKNIIEKL